MFCKTNQWRLFMVLQRKNDCKLSSFLIYIIVDITFLYNSSVYSCHFLISSAFVRSVTFLSFIEPLFAWNVPLVALIFLKRSFSLVFPIVFLYFFALIAEKGFLISPRFFGTLHSNGYIFPFLLCSLFLFFSQLFVSPPQTAILLFGFLFLGDCFDHHLLYSVLRALCLSDLVTWIYLLLLLYNHKGFDLGWFRLYLNGLVVFHTFFNLSVIFALRSSWSEPQSTPGLVFAHCIELLHLWLPRIESILFQYWPSGDVHV